MHRTRLIAFLAALVLILSLTVPALADGEPAKEAATSVSYQLDDAPSGWICRTGDKIFYMDYQRDGDEVRYYLTVMEPALGGYRTTQLFEMPQTTIASFQGQIYLCSWNGDRQCILSVDPETYQQTEVISAADGVHISRVLGVIDDKLYISAYDEGQPDSSLYIYHINSDSTVQQDVYLDEQGLEQLFMTVPSFLPHRLSPGCDGLYALTDEGTLLHLTTSLEYLDEYILPDTTFISSGVYLTGDTLYGLSQDGFVRMKVGGSDYEPVTQRIQEQGVSVFAIDMDQDYLYFCNLSEDGSAMLYRADAGTLQVQLMTELPLDISLFTDNGIDASSVKAYSYKLDESHFMLWLTNAQFNQWQLVTLPSL